MLMQLGYVALLALWHCVVAALEILVHVSLSADICICIHVEGLCMFVMYLALDGKCVCKGNSKRCSPGLKVIFFPIRCYCISNFAYLHPFM